MAVGRAYAAGVKVIRSNSWPALLTGDKRYSKKWNNVLGKWFSVRQGACNLDQSYRRYRAIREQLFVQYTKKFLHLCTLTPDENDEEVDDEGCQADEGHG